GDGNFQAAAQGLKDGKKSGEFFGRGNAGRTRTRGFGADVEDVRAGTLLGKGGIHSFLRGKEFAAIGKAVRSDIQNAHDKCTFTKKKRACGKFQAKAFSLEHA